MPSITLNKGLTYFYTDNGAPNTPNYKTIIMFHGHTFHSGTFHRLSSVATARDVRLICTNRREYPGSTPFTEDEIKTLNEGCEAEREAMIEQQGVDYALFVDGIIRECALPSDGGISLVAWSLGNIFLLALLGSITSLPSDPRKRLTTYVTEAILWDIPSQAIGVGTPEGVYHPLWDMNLSPEARGQVFGVWCSSYWKHGDISSRDLSQLEDRDADESKTATVLKMSPEDLVAVADFAPGEKWETAVCEPFNFDILIRQVKRAIFDNEVRDAWKNMKLVSMYGGASVWNIIHGVWILENWQKELLHGNEPLIKFKQVEGANHFFMWDEPERAMDCLLQCSKV